MPLERVIVDVSDIDDSRIRTASDIVMAERKKLLGRSYVRVDAEGVN